MSVWALNKSPQMAPSLQLSHFLTRPEIMAATANVATEQLLIIWFAWAQQWGWGEADTVTGEKFTV